MGQSVSSRQSTFFEADRLTMPGSIDLTVESLLTHGVKLGKEVGLDELYQRWAVAWSGGKDSTLLLVLLIALIKAGKIPPPRELTVLYADTRQELPPLAVAAAAIRAELDEVAEDLALLGCKLTTRVVLPPMDDRFMVYMLGRGVPPPSNRMRWCTERIKVRPMAAELERLAGQSRDKVLLLTGLRVGESAARDQRIALACGKDGGECGQGWFQETLSGDLVDTLAPILWWRVCHVWQYLVHHAPNVEPYFPGTRLIAEAYGFGDEAEENTARTGCIGCPVVSEDRALARICAMPEWAYLSPLKALRGYYWDVLRSRASRLQKVFVAPPLVLAPKRLEQAIKSQRRRDGQTGPLTFEARRAGLAFVLGLQAEVNDAARRLGRPRIDILNAEEEARILELIAAETWPDGWDGDEPIGSVMTDVTHEDGSVQPLLLRVLEES
jgi:DNA sulfur modification protein DndC